MSFEKHWTSPKPDVVDPHRTKNGQNVPSCTEIHNCLHPPVEKGAQFPNPSQVRLPVRKADLLACLELSSNESTIVANHPCHVLQS